MNAFHRPVLHGVAAVFLLLAGALDALAGDARAAEPDKPVQLFLHPFPIPAHHMDGTEKDITVYLHVANQDHLYGLCKVKPRLRDAINTYVHARGVPIRPDSAIDTRRAGAVLKRVIERAMPSARVSGVTVADGARMLEDGPLPGTAADNPRNCISINLRAKRLKAN